MIIKDWYYQAVVFRLKDGSTVNVVCNLGRWSPDDPTLLFIAIKHDKRHKAAFDILRAKTLTEVFFDGKWWKVELFTNPPSLGALDVSGWDAFDAQYPQHPYDLKAQCAVMDEPPAGVTMPALTIPKTIREQIEQIIDSAAHGITAKQIGESVECSQRFVFTELAALCKAGRIEKRGSEYFKSHVSACGG